MFQSAELREDMRERGDTKVTDLLNKIRVRNVDGDVQKQIRERFIALLDINYPEKGLHKFAQYYPTVKHNRKMLNKLPESGVESTVESEFNAYYSLIYKARDTNDSKEYQPHLLPDSLMEGNNENLNSP